MSEDIKAMLAFTSDLGEFRNPTSTLPPRLSYAQLETALFSAIGLHDKSLMKKSGLPPILRDIDAYFIGVTADKDKLLQEEDAEAGLKITAAALSVAAIISAEIPLAGFILGLLAAAAAAAATGVQIAEDKLKGTVIEEITNANGFLVEKHQLGSFEGVLEFMSFNQDLTFSLPLMGDSASSLQKSATLSGLISVIKQRNKGVCSLEDLDTFLADFYDITQKHPDKLDTLSELLIRMESGENSDEVKKELKAFYGSIPPAVGWTLSGLSLAAGVGRLILGGRVLWLGKVAAAAEEGEEVVTELSDAASTLGEVLAGAGILFAGISLFFALFDLSEAQKLDKKFTEAIKNTQEDLREYYETLLDPQFKDAYPLSDLDHVVGDYIAKDADGNPTNDWGIVTITKTAAGEFVWKNKANVSWALRFSQSPRFLNVGSDCPYFKPGNISEGSQERYQHAAIKWNGNKVEGIVGPAQTLYEKQT
jgi:hypothetical protein